MRRLPHLFDDHYASVVCSYGVDDSSDLATRELSHKYSRSDVPIAICHPRMIERIYSCPSKREPILGDTVCAAHTRTDITIRTGAEGTQ